MGRKPLAYTHLRPKRDTASPSTVASDDESSSDEGGRSAVGKPKRKRSSEDCERSDEPHPQSKQSARFGAFLDAHQVKKKKNKKHKKSKLNAAQQ